MKLQAITYFNELVRSRSIRQAAETLGVSPTAISRQLDNLEHYFGAPLIIRNARGITLTAAGETLAIRCKEMMRDITKTKQSIDDLRGLKQGNVSIYVNGAAIHTMLAPALAQFYTLYPAITITVTVSSAHQAVSAVLNGNTDMAVTMFSEEDPQLDIRFKLPVRHELIMAKEHPLSRLEAIPLKTVRDYPVAMPDRSFGIRRHFDHLQRIAGIEPINPTFTTSSLELQKEVALRTSTLLVLPAMSVIREIRANELTVRPFETPYVIETDLQLSRAKNVPPSFAAAKFAEFLETFLPQEAEVLQKEITK